jgi:eukaryotic-like serine/threonine-protein kinase
MSALAQLQPGTVFAGDFRVVQPLKEGGMGAVYVVEQLSTSKPRALKVLLPELVSEPSMRRRFETEARVGARIRSDHVVEVIASGVDAASGVPWLVMELLEGEDLEAYARRRGPIPAAEVSAIVEQLCHALGEAHREGIVHRDLKPENICLQRHASGVVPKVLDFGLAKVRHGEQRPADSTALGTSAGLLIGTLEYMAPEQVAGDEVSPAWDVWAVTIIAYEMLIGRHPFRQPIVFGYAGHSDEIATGEHSGNSTLSSSIETFFQRALSRNRLERPANADEFLAAIEQVIG